MNVERFEVLKGLTRRSIHNFYRRLESLDYPPPSPGELYPVDYRPIYLKEIESDAEMDFSKRTQNGTNRLYFYSFRAVMPGDD